MNKVDVLQRLQAMDADSSYGGSDTAQDSNLGHETSSLETSMDHHQQDATTPSHHHNAEGSPYYKNEVTLPVNCDETDAEADPHLPHYKSTAKLNIQESLENHSNLEEMNKHYGSKHKLSDDSPEVKRKTGNSYFHKSK